MEHSYTGDNLKLIEAIEKHGATAYVGQSTLKELSSYVTDYGDLLNLITDIDQQIDKSIEQTNNSLALPVCEKLVNIFKLQQDILSGNDFKDFIIVHFNFVNKLPIFDVHPGRTRMLFKDTYHKPINVLFIDYAGLGSFKNFLPFNKENCFDYIDHDYNLVDNWTLPQDLTKKYLLTMSNENENWHWPMLNESVTFEVFRNDWTISKVTANGESLIELKDGNWIIPL